MELTVREASEPTSLCKQHPKAQTLMGTIHKRAKSQVTLLHSPADGQAFIPLGGQEALLADILQEASIFGVLFPSN